MTEDTPEYDVNNNPRYVAYVLTHRWLSGIQKGIQGAHALCDLAHHHESQKTPGYIEWVNDHKTIIMLDGGNHHSLLRFYWLVSLNYPEIPMAAFREDEESLNECCTAVALIIDKSKIDEAVQQGIDVIGPKINNVDSLWDHINETGGSIDDVYRYLNSLKLAS